MNDDAETARLLQAGRLEQVCPDCGRREAAGHYCTGCARPTGSAEWYKPEASASRAASLVKAQAKRHPQSVSRVLHGGNGGQAA